MCHASFLQTSGIARNDSSLSYSLFLSRTRSSTLPRSIRAATPDVARSAPLASPLARSAPLTSPLAPSAQWMLLSLVSFLDDGTATSGCRTTTLKLGEAEHEERARRSCCWLLLP